MVCSTFKDGSNWTRKLIPEQESDPDHLLILDLRIIKDSESGVSFRISEPQ